MKSIADILGLAPVIPVLTIAHANDAVPLARALVDGGLRVLEVTLRTESGIAAIAAIARGVPDAVVGAGTVLNAEDHARACDAGAQFIVSPGLTDALLRAAEKGTAPLLPGVVTPGEIMRGLDAGLSHFKFFPAEGAGGPAALRSLAGPFAQVRFCPTGGVTAANAPDYLALQNVVCVGGTWLAPKSLVDSGNWAAITELAKAAARLRPPKSTHRSPPH